MDKNREKYKAVLNKMGNMKIQYDHQIFTSQRYGGISRYFMELITRYDKCQETAPHIAASYTINSYLSETPSLGAKPFFQGKNFKGKQRLLHTINKFKSINQIRKKDFSVFHPTYYDPYFLRYIGDKPFVVTVHDLIHEIFPDMVHPKDFSRKMKEAILPRASFCISISEKTKQDLVKYYRVPEHKIRVVYHGAPEKIEAIMPTQVPEKPYVLFVGKRGMYKNFSLFLKSLSDVVKTRDLNIWCVGGGAPNKQEVGLVETLGIQNRVMFSALSDPELAYSYANAEAFVFPSIYEGFGLPILEAFTYGCPVVLAQSSCFPEIAEDAALYFDPKSENDLRQQMERMLDDSMLGDWLRKKGEQRLKKFSWEETAHQTLNIYKDLF